MMRSIMRPEQRDLQDIMTCITRKGVKIEEAGRAPEMNAERASQGAPGNGCAFAKAPEAIEQAQVFAGVDRVRSQRS